MKRVSKILGFASLYHLLFLFTISCSEKKALYQDPYADGRAPLGIIVNRQEAPVPEQGNPGDVITIHAKGLLPYKDRLQFLINGQVSEIIEISDIAIKVKVPLLASSGVTAFVLDNELVYGPNFTVRGKIYIDPTFRYVNGTNGAIHRATEDINGNYMLYGNFTNYDNKSSIRPIRRIVKVLHDGNWDAAFGSGAGSNGTLYDMTSIGGFNYIGGSFSGYAQRGGGISNLTRINSLGLIDTVEEITYTGMRIMVPRFNGGVDATIRSIYSRNNKIIATGDFKYYLSRRYNTPNYKELDSIIIDSVDVRQLVRINLDGTLDKTWRFDENAIGYQGKPGRSFAAGTGRLYSLMHLDGKILAYGQFPKFDNQSVGYIVRLNEDGTIDQGFNSGGSGADHYINHASYNEQTSQYMLVGPFRNFNGIAAYNIVMLNHDGSVNTNFKSKIFENGTPNYVKQLKDGKILVGGSFKKYDKVNRQGFMILNPDGSLAEGYNNTGSLNGTILDVVETTSSDNKRALLIVGSFTLFDNKEVRNIIRLVLD